MIISPSMNHTVKYLGSGPTWLFDIDTLTKTMNYQLVTAGNQSNLSEGVQEQFDAKKAGEKSDQQYVLFPVWSSGSTNPQNTDGDDTLDEKKPESEINVSPRSSAQSKKHDDKTKKEAKGKSHVESLTGYRNLSSELEDFFDNNINKDNAAGTLVLAVGQLSPNSTNTFSVVGPSNAAASPTHGKSLYDVGAEVDFNNLETSITVNPILTTRVHREHHVTQIIGDLCSATQTRSMTRVARDQGRLSQINNDDFHTCMFACFLSQEEPKRSAFLYGTTKEEVYVCQPPRFEDPDYLDKVYKVVKELYSLHQALRAWYETLANYLLENGLKRGKIDQTLFIKRKKDDILLVQIYVDDIIFGSANKDLCKAFEKLMKDKFQMSSIGELTFFLGLQVKQKKDRMFISQDKFVAEILRKFGLTDGKSASTPIDTEKPLLKDLDVKRIFRYLKGKPHLGLWYPKDSTFDLVSYLDSDYVGASLDRKSTTEGCQFLRCRLISKQCKKQTVVATSSTEAEYIAAVSCCAQVLWIQNQLLDYGLVGKGFSGVDTPLFEGMLVVQEVGEGDADEVHVEDVNAAGVATEGVVSAADDVVPNDTVIDDVSKQGGIIANIDAHEDVVLEDAKDVAVEKYADVEDNADIQGRKARSQAEIYKIDLEHGKKVLSMQEEESEPAKLQEVVDVVTTAKIITEVVTAGSDTIIAASTTITAANVPIPAATIDVAPTLTADPNRRRKGVEPKPLKKQAQTKQDETYAREIEAELNKNIDWDEVTDHVQRKQKKDKAVKRYQALKRKPQTKAQARKNMMIYLRNVVGFKMDYFEGMTYDDIRPIFEKQFDSNMAFLQKTKEQMDEEDRRALKRLNKMPNDEDDVNTEATPLAHKVLVVDYEIYNENNKPYFKIKRADGSHQLYLSFLSMLRNFDREDLETLWRFVKERFATTKPKNFSDDFLLITLGERRYPLTRLTLDQMLNNVRLEVEEESEVSLELLGFIRQQHQEGFQLE
uniref:Uncharacterized mitochondrial protein AtMg00810-like n=1 Tax=Tanacetum cinerariifolium TaxID=118510 RepID=A0A6L2JWV0_TANCI|nr:uncharacterized mitochondrial protein AtMg00810-like [Tanacetum cinerariifolium]